MPTIIHPSAVVEDGAQIGADCEIMAHAVVTRHAILGDRVVVYPGAVVGGDPQYIKFDRATPSVVRVGAGTVIRADQMTVVGERCFLMAGSHAGHDCVLGNDVVLANNALLAGHVSVGDFSFVGGGAAIHQFCRIGESAMVGGLSRITRDLAPFTITAERDEVSGLNLVGLKRRGFSRDAIRELKQAFRFVYFGFGNIRELAATALANGGYETAQARQFLEFFAGGKRGFARAERAEAGENDA
jgi:UDP-N-acetylglucosamine acyltransferase